jgi:hypothetical protein
MESKGFTYHYNASALGLGGVLEYDRGVTKIVPSLASVALADSGGEGFGEITNYDRDGVSFSHASCHVMGYDSAYKTFTTSSEVIVTNLNLFDRVKATILQTSICSTREVDGSNTTESPDMTSFSMHSMIRGLTVDGVEVIPQFDLELCRWPTYAEFDKKYAKRLGAPAKSLAGPVANAQPIRASFVKALDYGRLGRSQSFKLPVSKFGTIHFGELVVKPGNRHVNLLRIEFDSMLRVQDGRPVAQRRVRSGAAPQDAPAAADDVATAAPSPRGGTMTMLTLTGNGVPSWP